MPKILKKTFHKKKKFAKKKFHKKGMSMTGYISGSKLGYPFPPMLKAIFKTAANDYQVVAAGLINGNPLEYNFKFNGVMNIGPALNYPLGTLSAYSTNVPTGLKYLLAPEVTASGGANAPYSKYFVTHSKIRVCLMNVGVTNLPLSCIIMPRAEPATATALPSAVLQEQPLATTFIIPQVLNEVPRWHERKMDTKTLFGLTSLSNSNSDYTGSVTVDPVALGDWLVRFQNADNQQLNGYTLMIKFEIIHEIILWDRNLETSTIPS